MEQTYRVNVKVRRRGEAALDDNRIEFKSEDFTDDEDLCWAVASELLELLKQDREYLEGKSDERD
jgi:hypothetical protein